MPHTATTVTHNTTTVVIVPLGFAFARPWAGGVACGQRGEAQSHGVESGHEVRV